MAENERRKSLYMRLAPIVDTYDEVIKNKLESGKFPFTRPGIIKIISMICLIASLGLFFGIPLCEDTSNWYPYLFPSSTILSLIVLLVLYIIFSSGLTTKNPSIWVKIDIIINLLLSFLTIFCNILTMSDCTNGDSSKFIMGSLDIAGCITSIIGCICIFLMYRFRDETTQEPDRRPVDPRKSVFA